MTYPGPAPAGTGPDKQTRWRTQRNAIAEWLLADGHAPGRYYGMYWSGVDAVGAWA